VQTAAAVQCSAVQSAVQCSAVQCSAECRLQWRHHYVASLAQYRVQCAVCSRVQSADCSVGLTLAVRVVYFVVVQDAQVGNVVRIRRIAERKSIGGKVCRRLNASVVPCRQKRQAGFSYNRTYAQVRY
jgi:hypothetical protein